MTTLGLFGWLAYGFRNDVDREAALAEYWRGAAQSDKGEFLAAVQHYEVYRQFQKSRGGDDPELLGTIAGCLWRGGKEEEALKLFDESIARKPLWYVCVDKALCMAKRDPPAALSWLHGAPMPPERRPEALADFHRQRGEFSAAIPALEEVLRQVRAEKFFAGEDHLVGVDLPLEDERHNELAALLDPLTDLAECHFRLEHLDLAESYAQRGVAVGQKLNESKGYLKAAEVEAGSAPCRLWLARVAMTRQDWSAASLHLAHAQVVGDRYPYQQSVRSVAAELERRRAGK